MILNLLPSDFSDSLRSCRIEIVADNAISPVHSWSNQVQPPVQLTPFGSAWMKMGSCPAKVKERMKLHIPGTRLTKQDSRWRASINQKQPSASDDDLLRQCQSESNIPSPNSSNKPKMPVRTVSPKMKAYTVNSESMENAMWDEIMGPSQPSSLLDHFHPAIIPSGLQSCPSSVAHSFEYPPSPCSRSLGSVSNPCLRSCIPNSSELLKKCGASERILGTKDRFETTIKSSIKTSHDTSSCTSPEHSRSSNLYWKRCHLAAPYKAMGYLGQTPEHECFVEANTEPSVSADTSSPVPKLPSNEMLLKQGRWTTEMVQDARSAKCRGKSDVLTPLGET